ncbi:MAG: ATP-dependent helicase [Allomuricauda sp.]|nr:MAG: ATP-dependent helicase [Allomuricauda sp.]
MVNFKILSASAGTGKTYQLTKAYLLVLLKNRSPQNFRNLLALTFTNKAVAEMKQRILFSLSSFASTQNTTSQDTLFNEVADALKLNAEELAELSKKTLQSLLHNYAFFDVSTIDAFNYRLIRTFAKDLNISQNFEVELDTDYVLGKAVNRVLEKAGTNKTLTSLLVEFAFQKIDEGKSWNISFDMKEIGKLIYQENHNTHLKSLATKETADFLELRKELENKIRSIEAIIKNEAETAFSEISRLGFDLEDFSRGTIPNHFKMHLEGEAKPEKLYKNAIENNLRDNRGVIKASIQKETGELSRVLLALYQNIKGEFHKKVMLQKFLGKITPLALIAEIQREIETLKEENAFLTINEFNELISREIKKQPIPYIYERMGERYRHYFIDEFQDTSVLQWENLIPLIGHALESANDFGQPGSLLLVGDVKQSIYRWRGGEPQQFKNLVYGLKNPFTITPQVEKLQKNWRSHDEIITFNNHFFSFVAKAMQNEAAQKLYAEASQQETNHKKGGVVKIALIANETGREPHPHCEKTLSSIQEIIGHGHPHAAICILVRNKRNEHIVAEYLIENEVPVISAEGLLLENNEIVDFLISFLHFILNPLEKEYAFAILSFLLKDSVNIHDTMALHADKISDYLRDNYGVEIASLKFLGTLDIVETLLNKLNLISDSNAYVMAFLDAIVEYEKTSTAGIHGFLEYWHLKKSKLALPMPENMNAVKIMTIHKSKGLEFPFVIFPFADERINDSRKQGEIWVPVAPDEHSGFEALMATNNRFLPYYSEAAAAAHDSENEKSTLDDFNVLYVALTRAVKGLYIISSPTAEQSEQISYATLIGRYLQTVGFNKDEMAEMVFGRLEVTKETMPIGQQSVIGYGNAHNFLTSIEIAKQEVAYDRENDDSVLFGNLVHSLLADIHCEDDISKAIATHTEKGMLKGEEIKGVENLLYKVVQNENLSRYFAKHIDAKNESEILTEDGSVIRPDRLVFDQGKVSIIDFKTGGRLESHRHQIEKYADVISKMGHPIDQKVLVYINKEINTVVV